MYKFLRNIIVFFFCFFCIDKIAGYLFDYMNSHVRSGDSKHSFVVYNVVSPDIVILGTSRASHHYVTSIFEDSFKMSAYNCGYDGLGILNDYARYKMICKRHKPKMVILDVYPDPDIYDTDNMRFLSDMKPYASNKEILKIFESVSPLERYKLWSKMYRYNTRFIQLLHDNLIPSRDWEGGYSAIYKSIDYNPEPYKIHENEPDPVKCSYMERLMNDIISDSVKLFVVASPYYNTTSASMKDFEYVIALCKKYNIEFINLFTDKEYIHDKTLFADPSHLNHEGAMLFSRDIVQIIKANYKKEKN